MAVAFLARLAYAPLRPLLPDEAYYWAWSRHLQGGYLDHPGGVAFVIRAGTAIFGNTAFGVRFFGAVLLFAMLGTLIWITHRVTRDGRAAAAVAAMWLCSPLFNLVATVITPDTPAAFGGGLATALGLWIAQRIDRGEPVPPARWLLLGVACGISLVAKYTTVLTPFAITLALLASPAGRRQFLRPGIYLAGIIALLAFSPVIVWNARHHWVSFAFQLNHGLAEQKVRSPAWGAFEFVGGQLGVWTPVLLGLGLIAIGVTLRRWRSASLVDRMLLISAATPLLFFGYANMRTHGEANWPLLAYGPMSILTAKVAIQRWDAWRGWLVSGCGVALAVTLFLQVPEFIYGALGVKQPQAIRDLQGWPSLGEALAAPAAGVDAIVANRHQDAGEIAFYLPGQPQVWGWSDRPPMDKFAYIGERPDFAACQRVLWIGGDPSAFIKRFGFTRAVHGQWRLRFVGHGTADRVRSYDVLTRQPPLQPEQQGRPPSPATPRESGGGTDD